MLFYIRNDVVVQVREYVRYSLEVDCLLLVVLDDRRLIVSMEYEAEVVEKTRRHSALNGERGGLLGRWVSNLPGQYAGLVLRDDGEFRIDHCVGGGAGPDFGLYRLDESARRLVLDSRFTPVQTLELDFY